MDTTIQTTAAEIRDTDFLHRVQPAPLSRIFEDAVDTRVDSVERQVFNGQEYVTVHLAGPYNSVLNLAPTRVVWVVRDENVEA